MVCEQGTVGWSGDETVADLGPGTKDVYLVKVTLWKGHPVGEPLATDGSANGHQILCRMTWPLWSVPDPGTQCIVLFPSGLVEAPGAGICIPTGGPTKVELPNPKNGEAFIMGPGGSFIRFHKDGGISMMTTDDGTTDGRSLYIMLSPTKGLRVHLPWGKLTLGPDGGHFVHSSGARLDLGAIAGLVAPLDALGSYAKLQAAMCSVAGTAVSLGTDAGVANAASVTALVTLLTALGVVIAAAVDPTGIPSAAKATFATALSTALPLIVDLGKVA